MNLNHKACEIAREMIHHQEELEIGVAEVGGATLIDCGVEAKGSFAAGVLFAEACMGGLGEVRLSMRDYGSLTLPCVEVKTRKPAIACLGSQKAGWSIKGKDFFSLGSGPARIPAKKPKETYEKLGYSEESDRALIALEAGKYPGEEVVRSIAEACGIETENLYILIARTASLAGSVQISARVVETALYKAQHIGSDTTKIYSAFGTAPVAPIIGNDARMMGVTNDMIIYGGEVYLAGEGIPAEELPSSLSPAYGKTFEEIFREANYDFYRINPAIFAPAKVVVNDIEEKKLTTAGEVNVEVLKKSLGLG
ncbi:methenyltetrahydromethanopterin cyclohydrolase [Candidatus Pyrohabitans sp.]